MNVIEINIFYGQASLWAWRTFGEDNLRQLGEFDAGPFDGGQHIELRGEMDKKFELFARWWATKSGRLVLARVKGGDGEIFRFGPSQIMEKVVKG